MHSSLLISHRGARIMIDCGLDWIKSVARVRPDAIVLTHAHPDHAGGLKNGSPCPVYATRETLAALGRFDISDPRLLHPRRPRAIRRILFEAFPVEHSILAPAVGYRITAASSTIFYGPDLIFIRDRPQALCGIDLYIGDGATITRPLVRRRGQRLIGHTTVQTQLTWCQKAHIERAIITHCGSGIVSAHSSAAAIIVRMAKDRGLDATIAHDGLKLRL